MHLGLQHGIHGKGAEGDRPGFRMGAEDYDALLAEHALAGTVRLDGLKVNPNPPKDRDGRREDSGRG